MGSHIAPAKPSSWCLSGPFAPWWAWTNVFAALRQSRSQGLQRRVSCEQHPEGDAVASIQGAHEPDRAESMFVCGL